MAAPADREGHPATPCESTSSDWERASEWLTAICVVTFDLELGQALELTYPDHVRLDEKETSNICYLSFPDSNSGCMGDSKFHIKVRSRLDDSCPVARHQKKCLAEYNKACPQWNQRAEATSHIYGFVYFRQTKNAQIKRGYFQKSIVLLTRLPFINLFYRLSDLVAPLFFQQPTEVERKALLAVIFQEVGRWPSLRDLLPQRSIRAEVLHLRLLNKVFQISPLNANGSLANRQSPLTESELDIVTEPGDENSSLAGLSKGSSIEGGLEIEIISNLQELDLFRHLECILKELHLLWELVLTNEPIIVIGNSPSICTQVVQSLVSLISPLLYCGEVRPYFTIHDSEFREFTQLFSDETAAATGNTATATPTNNVGQTTTITARRNCILGVTNPFFIKTLKDFPHTIRLDSSQVTSQGPVNGAEFLQQSYLKTSHKRFLQKDKSFVKKIQNGIKLKRPNFVQTLLIQRHFNELTQSFLFPLERYLALLMPLKREINPFKLDPPQPKPFVEAEFLQTIEKNGPQLTSTLKGDWSGLYRRFLKTPNFLFWLSQRVSNQRTELLLLHLETLTTVDVKTWAMGKAEVEVVDLVLKIRQKLNFLRNEFLGDEVPVDQQLQVLSMEDQDSNRSAPTNSDNDQRQRFISLRVQLVQQMSLLKSLLPEDLKNIL